MKKILLIDDADFARMILRRILQSKGYHICGEAKDGKEGLEKVRELKPDLIFCDMLMNNMNGIDFLKQILTEDPNANVVICSVLSEQPYITEALQIGARGFLEKPVFADKLIAITEEIIGKPEVTANYQELLVERATQAGLGGKPVLDFIEAFERMTGFMPSDPRVDEEFLKQNGERIIIGIRAMLSSRMHIRQREQLEGIFRGLIQQPYPTN